MDPIECNETETVEASAAEVFAVAAGPDAPAIFRRRGPIPGVIGVSGHVDPWSESGQTRKLRLEDGHEIVETLDAFALNERFSYRASGFAGLFGALVDSAEGEWRFLETAPGRTRVEWRYAFTPASAPGGFATRLIVRALWPGYMRAALRRIKERAERGQSASA